MRRTGRTRRIGLVLLAPLALTGCSLELLPGAGELGEDPQMIAIRADPPEVNPGDVVTLDALVHWPEGDWEGHWLVCIPTGEDLLSNCVEDNFPADGDVPECLTEPDAGLCRLPAGPVTQVLVPPIFQIPPDVSFPVFVELLVADADLGWEGCRDAVAEAVPSAGCLLGLKTVWLSGEAEPNVNPRPVELLVDDVTHDASMPMVIGADASDLDEVVLELALVVDASSIDEFAQDDDAVEDAELDVAWFTTCGSITEKSRDDPSPLSQDPDPGDVNCYPAADPADPPDCDPARARWKPRTPGRCVVHAVVRDGLGGIGFLTREFEVRGREAPDKERTVQACNCRTTGDGVGGLLALVLLLLGWLLWRRERSSRRAGPTS